MSETKLTRDHHLWTRDTIKNVSGDVTLDLAGDLTIDTAGGDMTIPSTVSSKPYLRLQNNNGDANGSTLNFYKSTVSSSDDDTVGQITFMQNDDDTLSPTYHTFGSIVVQTADVSDGDCGGRMELKVASHNGTATTGLKLEDGDASGEVDINIGAGSSSVTTVAGNLTITTFGTSSGNFLTESSGAVQKRTAAEVLSDIGAQATVTAGTNCTFSGTTLNVDDAFIKNDADDEMAGTLAITSTTSDQFKVKYDANNYALLNVSATGDLEIETIGAGTTDSDLTLNIDGDIILNADGGQVTIKDDSASHFLFDCDATRFRIYDDTNANDFFTITVGAEGETTITTTDADTAVGHLNIEPDGHVEFDNCGVGFDLVTPTYNASNTSVDFKTGNKQFVTFGSGNITNLQLVFPATSGNFVVLLKQDGTGSRTITNYKVYDSGGSLASGSNVALFAGGSNPTLTTDANHVDIISIFWDADNEIAYAVASLDFQF